VIKIYVPVKQASKDDGRDEEDHKKKGFDCVFHLASSNVAHVSRKCPAIKGKDVGSHKLCRRCCEAVVTKCD
jgi:hypothetical protein